MHTRIVWVLIGCLAITLLACGENTEVKEQANVVAKKSDATDSKISKPELKIYETFDEIEHLFNYQNDTTYVINFWATWCKPCVAELPYFDDLYNEYKSEKVKIILVSLDFPKQIEKKLIPFLEKNNVLPEVVMLKDGDVNAWGDKVSKEWDGAIPVTIIYNRNEKVFVSGEVADYAELKSKVKKVISI